MTYHFTHQNGWVILSIRGKARNNEPLQAKRHILPWLEEPGVRLIVNLEGLEALGVLEMGLLNSLRKEVDLRGGTLRLCRLNPALQGYFQQDRFTRTTFHIYTNVDSAMVQKGEHP